MDYIYNLLSDGKLTDDLSNWLRNRNLEQKLLYLWEWANLYYIDKEEDEVYINSKFSTKELVNLWLDDKFDTNDNITIISLGSWNSQIEKWIFKEISNKYKNLKYIAVDSSRAMLNLSIENLKDLDIEKKFICADFSSNAFKREIEATTQDDEIRIFVFFSNTFGNINHTNIIDILYNLLRPGERIWLDVRLRKWTTAKDDMEASEYYFEYIKSDVVNNFFSSILKRCWIPSENWQISLKTKKEATLNALKFKLFFNINKKTHIKIRNEVITMLPKEYINLLQIYTYDSDGLVSFFQEHGFKLLEKQLKESRWQFLFEKI